MLRNDKYGYLPAFTIVEAVVSMVITAIVLSVIFVIFSITAERLHDFRKQNEYIADMNRFTYSINKCISESEEMKLAGNELVFKTYMKDTVKYDIADDYFVKFEKGQQDTFRLSSKAVRLDTLRSHSGKQVFQRLQWKIVDNHFETDLNFFRKVYADRLLKQLDKDEF